MKRSFRPSIFLNISSAATVWRQKPPTSYFIRRRSAVSAKSVRDKAGRGPAGHPLIENFSPHQGVRRRQGLVSCKSFAHRKPRILERLQFLTEVFAIVLCADAWMSNCNHLIR